MAIKLEDKQNVLAPGGSYQYGNIKDETGLGDGTPVDVNTYADFHQFFARMLDKSLITPNGLPDNSTNGFQYYEALKAVANQYTGVNTYNSNTALVDADFGALSVMDLNGNADFTLPPLAVATVLQKIVVMKLGTGVTNVLPDGTDVIVPAEGLILRGGDSVTLVSFGFGWIVESRYKQIDRPIVIDTTSIVSYTQANLGCLNIINYFGNGTYTLPPSDANSSGKSIHIQKQQPGLITIQANGTDTITPTVVIQLDDGDAITLESTLGIGWVVTSRFDASQFNALDTWHKVGQAGEPALGTGWTTPAGYGIHFKKSSTGMVTVWGRAQYTAGGTSSMFIIPAAYRIDLSTIIGGLPQIQVCGFALKEDATMPTENWTVQVNHNTGSVDITDPTSGLAPPTDQYWFTLNWQL